MATTTALHDSERTLIIEGIRRTAEAPTTDHRSMVDLVTQQAIATAERLSAEYEIVSCSAQFTPNEHCDGADLRWSMNLINRSTGKSYPLGDVLRASGPLK